MVHSRLEERESGSGSPRVALRKIRRSEGLRSSLIEIYCMVGLIGLGISTANRLERRPWRGKKRGRRSRWKILLVPDVTDWKINERLEFSSSTMS